MKPGARVTPGTAGTKRSCMPVNGGHGRAATGQSDPAIREQETFAAAEALLAALTVKDHATAVHCEGVVTLARCVAQRLGMDDEEIEEVELAARLHDVGKIGIPSDVLLKAGPLSDSEWTLMRSHADRGAEIVARVPQLRHLSPAVRHAHERWDGEGYPAGLAGEDIPLASRIVFVCD